MRLILAKDIKVGDIWIDGPYEIGVVFEVFPICRYVYEGEYLDRITFWLSYGKGVWASSVVIDDFLTIL